MGRGVGSVALPRPRQRSRHGDDAPRLPLASGGGRRTFRRLRLAALQGRRHALPRAGASDDRIRRAEVAAHALALSRAAQERGRHGEGVPLRRRDTARPAFPHGALQRRWRGGADPPRLGRDREPVRRVSRGEPESELSVRPPEPLGADALLAAARGIHAGVRPPLHGAVHGRPGGTFRRVGVPRPVRHGQEAATPRGSP